MSEQLTIRTGLDAKLKGAERIILGGLGGTPWTADLLTASAVTDARTELRALQQAAGFKGGRWLTTQDTNPKMAKAGLPTIGVTIHSAERAGEVWTSLDDSMRSAIAGTLRVDVATISRRLQVTMCPMATEGCKNGVCTAAFSANASFRSADLSRLVRTLMFLFRPASGFALLGNELATLHSRRGSECRWRVNINDDVRWELVAPGLFELGTPGYVYTKYSPAQRPGRPDMSVVYSATEKTTDEEIHEMVGAGHRVALVLDVPRKAIPERWQGLRVANGDKTDDLFAHPPGVVVGLAAKGKNRRILQQMRKSGFARSAA